jgi:hypothetical protein
VAVRPPLRLGCARRNQRLVDAIRCFIWHIALKVPFPRPAAHDENTAASSLCVVVDGQTLRFDNASRIQL